MSRLVRAETRANPPPAAVGFHAVRVRLNTPGAPQFDGAAADQTTDVDNYTTRIVKYIPAEVVSFYLASDKLAAHLTDPGDSAGNLGTRFVSEYHFWVSLIIFVLGLVGTPFYLKQQAQVNQPWLTHAVVSTIAFVIWAYAVRGTIFADIYVAGIAGILVLVFTFVSGLVIPIKAP